MEVGKIRSGQVRLSWLPSSKAISVNSIQLNLIKFNSQNKCICDNYNTELEPDNKKLIMQNKFEIAKVSPTHALHLPRILCFSIISLFLLSWNALFISRPTVRCSEAHCVCSNLRNLKYKGRTGRERKSEGSEEKVGKGGKRRGR